jgi:hypothetical protein
MLAPFAPFRGYFPDSKSKQFNSHGDDFVISPKRTKTYGRFLGMIFFGGLETPQRTVRQLVARGKNAEK